MQRRLLGYGKSRDFQSSLLPGELAEEGNRVRSREAGPGQRVYEVFAIKEADFCRHCEGAGCKACKFTGECRKQHQL